MRRRIEKPNSEAGQTAPGIFRVYLSKASARNFTKEMQAAEFISWRAAKNAASNKVWGLPPLQPRWGTPQTINPLTLAGVRGFECRFLRSQSVASALDLRSGATPHGSISDYNKEKKTRASGYFLT